MTVLRSHNRPARVLRFGAGILAAGALLGASLAPTALAQAAEPQAQIVATTAGQSQPLTVSQTEGPYFKTNSPERTSLLEEGMRGTVLTLTGQVLDVSGQPVAGALVDFWQASASGQYDNVGYDLRGHQFTDENGNYTLTTVLPGLYPGRTRHIHVKVQAANGPVLTTQLYFAGEARNSTDGIFDPSLVLNLQNNEDGSASANFNFVVATA